MKDYSEYLNGKTAYGGPMFDFIESQWIKDPSFHDRYAEAVNNAIKKYKIKNVVEVGCGTGEVAKRLNTKYYTGVDANENCIRLAKSKNQEHCHFYVKNIREIAFVKDFDLSLTFAFLKHFGFHEWSGIFQKCASLGKYFIFDIPISGEKKDDGTEFHHVWFTLESITEECKNAGLKILETVELNKDELIFITKKVNDR